MSDYPDFPTLSRAPSRAGFDEEASDPTLRMEPEAGPTMTRARCTRIFHLWRFVYRFLTTADRLALLNFQLDRKVGSGLFYWQHPIDKSTFRVRFARSILWMVEPGVPGTWQAELSLEEESGTTGYGPAGIGYAGM